MNYVNCYILSGVVTCDGALKTLHGAAARFLECRHGSGGNRLTRRHAPVLGQWIYKRAVLPQAVIEMRAARKTRRTNAADDLPLRYPGARANARAEFGQVQVIGLVAARMSQ